MKPSVQPAQWAGYLQKYKLALLAALVLLIFAGAGVWALSPKPVLVVVDDHGQSVEFWTKKRLLETALAAEGIAVSSEDHVSLPLETSLKGHKEVRLTIRRAVLVHLIVGGELQEVKSAAATVGDLLAQYQITLGVKDSVAPDPTSAITSGMEVKVVRRTEEIVVSQVEIPYNLIRRDDRTMTVGQMKELQEGAPGTMEVREVIYREDGQEIGREVLEETVVQEAVPQIVAYGTLGVVSRGGTEYRYTREIVMEATGYTAGPESNPNGNGYTYTGMKAVRGVVAVDPRVIPLYTRVYVEGYGPAIAADIGGAIKGNKIDLCFDTVEEALQWGRRPAKVYILD